MKKELKSMILAAVAALACGFSFTACSDIAVAEDGIANEDSRSAVIYVRKMTSDLNPGYGKAVYFTGTFEEGNDWTVAVRGTYEDGQWSYTVNTHRKSFEYKALIGDWDEGPVVTVEFPGLRRQNISLVIRDSLIHHSLKSSGYILTQTAITMLSTVQMHM